MAEKQKYSFKCSEQGCSNRVCCTREHVNVTLGDLSRWTSQKYLEHIIFGLEIHLPTDENDIMTIETARKPLKKSPEKTACIFFHEESNACSIRFGRPISCQVFPLSYNGEKFFVVDKACEGIGKGEVTRDSLKEAKELAEREYKEALETETTLPALYSVIMAHALKQSAEAMKGLSEEDRKRLEELLEKGRHAEKK